MNKVDLLPDPEVAADALGSQFPDAVPIAAETGWGVDKLLERIEEVLNRSMGPVEALVPYRRAIWSTYGTSTDWSS